MRELRASPRPLPEGEGRVSKYLLSYLLLLLCDERVHSVEVVVLRLPEFRQRVLRVLSNDPADSCCGGVLVDGFVALFPDVVFKTLPPRREFIERGLVGFPQLRIVLRFDGLLVDS